MKHSLLLLSLAGPLLASSPAGAGALSPTTPSSAQLASSEGEARQTVPEGDAGGRGRDAATPGGAADAPAPEATLGLLDLAFDSATAMPVDPHVKERSRTQERVVDAALQLDLPLRAASFAEGIENWRRGAAFADIATWCARRGHAEAAEGYLAEAQEVIDWPEEEFRQAWRRDRVRVKAARALVWLGRGEDARALEADVVAAESGKVDAVRATLSSPSELDARLAAIDGAFRAGDLDQVRSALDAVVELYDRFYDDAQARARVRSRDASKDLKAPVAVRIDLGLRLARVALDHADPETALSHLEEAEELLDGSRWLAQDEAPMKARLGQLLFEAGDQDHGRAELTEAVERVDAERGTLMHHYQAEALRPVAAAFHAVGDSKRALALYRRVVEEGAENLNARPRALALTDTCLSMALAGFEPPEDLLARLRQVRRGLGDPW